MSACRAASSDAAHRVRLSTAALRLLQSDERIEAVVVLADGDVGADLGLAVDEPLGLQHGQRFADGVAGYQEIRPELSLGGQPVRVAAGVDLVPDHVGDQPGLVGARSA